MRTTIAAILAMALLAGCSAPRSNPAPAPMLTPPVAEAVPEQENPGSLFDPAEAHYLYGDNRARNVGDVVLVNIVETSDAKHEATTKSDRDSSIDFGIESWAGKGDAGLVPIVGSALGLKGKVGSTSMFKAKATNAFQGDGETERKSHITATLAARVVRQVPGGLLQIEGAREIKVNNETQILVVRGLVRAKDISPDNSISSTYLADAKIEYFGEGVLADKQRPGWLTRILDNVWPF
ncbi:flagellar basal body L-ring protein FlgH [Desulfocurvus sp. DL9XJH121]